jgi:hypothetical protein
MIVRILSWTNKNFKKLSSILTSHQPCGAACAYLPAVRACRAARALPTSAVCATVRRRVSCSLSTAKSTTVQTRTTNRTSEGVELLSDGPRRPLVFVFLAVVGVDLDLPLPRTWFVGR